MILHYAIYLQEECDSLIDATIDGDMEVVSTLISDGVDMNAILHEVCITTSCCVSVLMSVMITIHMHNIELKRMLWHNQFQKSADSQLAILTLIKTLEINVHIMGDHP